MITAEIILCGDTCPTDALDGVKPPPGVGAGVKTVSRVRFNIAAVSSQISVEFAQNARACSKRADWFL